MYVWVTDQSTNGTYINGEKIPSGESQLLAPDDHITILRRDNAVDSRPNIGFRVVMALQKPKIADYYEVEELLGRLFLPMRVLMVVVPSDQSIVHDIVRRRRMLP
jgi:FHA domain